jgi:hypothetical protein
MTLPVFFTDTGSNKNENSHQLAIKLKDLAKVYNMIIVLAVLLQILISKLLGRLRGNSPYHIYAGGDDTA